MLDLVSRMSIVQLIIFSILLNVLFYGLSIGMYLILNKCKKGKYIQDVKQEITRRDLMLSFVVLLCNAAVFVLGVGLYKYGYIHVIENSSIAVIALQTLSLVIGMDFLMYVFHRLAHIPLFYPLAHLRHHEHSSVNAISLFVLHPVEAIGFGLLFILLLCIYPFDTFSIGLYLLINLIWGTIGHVDKDVFKNTFFERWTRDILCLTLFHNIHHQDPNVNYGFYTLLWDKLFKTYRKV